MNAQTLHWVIEPDGERLSVHLHGELTRDSFPPFQQAWLPHRRAGQNGAASSLCWYLEGVTRLDSTGFAFLCDCLNDGQQSAVKSVSVFSPPPQLLTLADLYGLSDWLTPFLSETVSPKSAATP